MDKECIEQPYKGRVSEKNGASTIHKGSIVFKIQSSAGFSFSSTNRVKLATSTGLIIAFKALTNVVFLEK